MKIKKRIKMKKFVTFEGIDGSGKSTVSKIIYKKLKDRGLNIVLTREPTNTMIGKCVKKCIQTDSDPNITSFTFIADRIQHGYEIQKLLDDGKIILCDRYAESTYAYQGAQLQDEIENPIKWLKELSKNQFPIPDRTYIFIINPKKAIQRIQNRDNLIPFEKINFLEKVNNIYIKLCRGERFIKIDATKTINEIVQFCLKDIME
jgi:dTMP kinase